MRTLSPVNPDSSEIQARRPYRLGRDQWMLSLLVFVPVALVMLAAWGASHVAGIPLASLTRDPLAELHAPFYLGAVSSFGVLLWAGAAAVCLFSAVLLRKVASRREVARFLLGAGLLTVALVADDLFMLHERVFPRHLRVPELVVFSSYLAAIVFLLCRFRHTILQSHYLVLFLSLMLFGTSIVIDVVFPNLWNRHLFEDGAKLGGIVGWLAYFTGLSARSVSQSMLTGPRRRRPSVKVREDEPVGSC